MSKKIEYETLGEAFVSHGLEWLKREYPESLKLSSRETVFNSAMTMWLMVSQKLGRRDSIANSVQNLRATATLDSVGSLVAKSKKFIFKSLSTHTGGLSNARQRLPLEKVELFCHHVSTVSDAQHVEYSKLYDYSVYVMDGSTIGLSNTQELREEFHTFENQHKSNHVAARVVVVHNVQTGVALRPEIGSLKDSEQTLIKRFLGSKQLPSKSIVIGDRNFGTFSIAFEAQQHNIIPLVRLQEGRVKKILGKQSIDQDGDYAVTWTASKNDLENKDIPSAASIRGRVICTTVSQPGQRSQRLFFFTTVKNLAVDQILDIYKRRWFIETDLRTIKSTVNLEIIKSRTPDMVRKEILLGVLGYSLIRSIIASGASSLKLDPRKLSFTQALGFIITSNICLMAAKNVKEVQIILDGFLRGLRQCILPQRKTQRIEPRALVGVRRQKFPLLKGTRSDARQKIISTLRS